MEGNDRTARVTLAEAIVDFIRNQTDCIFGIPGGYLNPFIHAVTLAQLRAIVPRHETSAIAMACGYSLASGQPAIAFAVPGGVTNTVTGLAAAESDNIPLFLLATQAPSNHFGKDGHQEHSGFTRDVEQLAVLRSTTAYAARVPSAESSMGIIHSACRRMMSQRRPVAIEVPVDYLTEDVTYERRPPLKDSARLARTDDEALDRLCCQLEKASAPLLVLGNRVAKRGVGTKLRELCEAATIPFATVDYAKGLIAEDHPLSLGVLGQCGHESAMAYARQSDLVITLGVRLSLQTTCVWNRELFPNLFQIDDDLIDIGREIPVRDSAVGDLPAMVDALHRSASRLGGRRDRKQVEQRVERLRVEHGVYRFAPTADMRSPTVLTLLRQLTPRDAYVVADVGLTAQFVKQYFPVYSPDGFFNLYGLGSMGCGMPLSLGVQAAAPARRVVNLIGDGGFLQYLGELSTQVEAKLPVVHFVLNNCGYKQIGDRLEWFFGHRAMCDFSDDLARVGAAFGLHGERVERIADLAPAVMRAFDAPRGAVIDIAIKGDNLSDVTPKDVREFQRKLFTRGTPNKWRL